MIKAGRSNEILVGLGYNAKHGRFLRKRRMSVVDEIKARIDIVELIGETVELRRSGKNYVGFCPFHPNTRTPAFAVFPETGTWRCKKEGWDFRQALHYLAERAGISLKEGTGEQEAGSLKQWRALLEEAVVFYQHHLHQPAGREALAYLQKRGLSASTLEAFGLGYAPRERDALVRYFASKGIAPAILAEVGLARIDEATGEARGDPQGRPVGFGARTLDPDGVPKYLNTPTTPLFDKGRLLYGLERAGKSLTAHQLRRLKNLTRNVYLALDPDPAGQRALWRSLDVARETAAETQVTLDARGLLRYEQRLQLNLRVVVLPEGKDPDEIVLEDPARWERLLAQARPLVLYLMDLMAQNLDMDDPKERARLAGLASRGSVPQDLPDPGDRVREPGRAFPGAAHVPRGEHGPAGALHPCRAVASAGPADPGATHPAGAPAGAPFGKGFPGGEPPGGVAPSGGCAPSVRSDSNLPGDPVPGPGVGMAGAGIPDPHGGLAAGRDPDSQGLPGRPSFGADFAGPFATLRCRRADAVPAPHPATTPHRAGAGPTPDDRSGLMILRADLDLPEEFAPSPRDLEEEEALLEAELAALEAGIGGPSDPVYLYLREIGKHELLTVDQEFWLGTMLEAERQFSVLQETLEQQGETSLRHLYVAVFKEMRASWKRVQEDASRLKVDPPELLMLLEEAQWLQRYTGQEKKCSWCTCGLIPCPRRPSRGW